jgi:N-ethylmaleimide reductase
VLFRPLDIGGFRASNRIVMAPLTRCRATDDGLVGELHRVYYAQRAGAGLIVSEATEISAEAKGYIRTPGIYAPAQIEAWRGVTKAVHQAGGRFVLQLWHVGRIAHPANRDIPNDPVAPSAIAAAGEIYTASGLLPFPVPREVQDSECSRIAADYASAARNAIEAGFDGVEIHAANGYLIDAFLHDHSNRRSGRYGGPIENRAAFLMEIVQAVGAVIGRSRVGVRLSPFGTFNDVRDSAPSRLFDHVIRRLNAENIGYLHVINPDVSGDATIARKAVKEDVAAFARTRFSGPLIVAGGYDRDTAIRLLSERSADAVAFGRAFIANPDLPRRFRDGIMLNKEDRSTFYTRGGRGYTDYPAAPLSCSWEESL